MNNPRSIVLAFFPNTRGFGFVCLENQKKLLDYGVAKISPVSNAKLLKQIIKQVDYYLPTLVLVQDYNSKFRRPGRRTQHLIDRIVEHAKEKQLPVCQYTREQIRDTFETWGAVSKHAITEQLLSWFPELRHRVPKERKVYKEDYNMGIFDALALAVTHNYLTE